MGILRFDARLRYESGFELSASFSAGAGVTALCGPSGSGKSTILGLIAGTLKPDSGVIRLGDRILVDIQSRVVLAPEKRGVGMVFQEHLLFPHLSVRANLLFGKGIGKGRDVDFKRVVEILEVGDLLDRSPDALSGGQRQRVALGRALLRGPDLLLMDEPLAFLDDGLKNRIITYLERALKEWKIPTLLVSHDLDEVARLAEHIIKLDAGKII